MVLNIGSIPIFFFLLLMFFELSILFSLIFFYNLLTKTALTRNAILVALYMVGAFILSGFFYLLVDFAFLGVILILVYVGAVVVLFLFVIIIIPLRIVFLETNFFMYFFNYFLWTFLLVFFFCNYIDSEIFSSFFNLQSSLFHLLALIIYLDKIWYFLVAAFLLTISIIGAISITQTKNVDKNFKEIINVQLNRNYKLDFVLYN